MATKVTVTTDLGTFSRRTVRTYSHIVVVIERQEALEARRADRVAYVQSAIAHYEAHPDDLNASWLPTHRSDLERLQVPITADGAPYVLGWTGRLDLAVKLAASAQRYREVRIYAIDGTRVR